MLTFLRCGVYRLVHGRKFWIGTALAAWYSLVVIASTELAFAVFGIRVADSEPLGQYWRMAGLNILGVVAVTFIVTALHTIVRSKVAGVIIAVFVASGAVSSLATSCAQLLGSRLDWIPHLVAWLPMVNLGLLDDSAPAVGLTSSATQGALGLPDIGMPVWAHALVCFMFHRFYQADGARSGSGSGLGLAVAGSLAESMGMRLYAAMDGMTLSITLDMGPAVHDGTGPGASMT